MALFVRDNLGRRFVGSVRRSLEAVLESAPAATPIMFIVSSGANPANEAEQLATKMNEDITVVSIGRGQEGYASEMLDRTSHDGGWAFVHNVHLAPAWAAGALCLRLDSLDSCHPRFRLFMSTDNSTLLPVAVLQVGPSSALPMLLTRPCSSTLSCYKRQIY